MVLNTRLSYFSSNVSLNIHDKYSSIRFKQCGWQRKILQIINFEEKRRTDRMAHWLEAALFSLEEVGMRVQIPPWQLPVFFFFHRFFTLWLFTFYWRPLDSRTRTTTSTRFDLKFFRVFSKYRLPGKLYFTIFH